MKLPAASNSFGVLFAEDFDDEEGPILDRDLSAAPAFEHRQPAAPTSEPVEPQFSAADLAEAQRAGHAAGYAEGFTAASEAASAARTSVLATMTERLSAARAIFDAMVTQQLDAATGATLAMVSACLPVLCEHAGTRDLIAVLHELMPSLVGEPELIVTVHPDYAATVEQELLPILGKNTPLQVETSSSMGRSDVDVAWRSGSAKRNTRALRREVIQMLRRSLRPHTDQLINEEHRHGR